MDERSRMVATGCNAEPFLFLNDLCFGPDGALYLTDSGVNIDNFPMAARMARFHFRESCSEHPRRRTCWMERTGRHGL